MLLDFGNVMWVYYVEGYFGLLSVCLVETCFLQLCVGCGFFALVCSILFRFC